MGMDTKRCSRCGETKPLDDYHNDRSKPDGKVTTCRACLRERGLERRAQQRALRPAKVPGPRPCSRCGVVKELDEFDNSSTSWDKKTARCKACRRVYASTLRRKRGVPERPVFVDTETHKTCHTCEVLIPRLSFGSHPTICLVCMAARARDYRERHPDKVRAAFKVWSDRTDPTYFVLKEAKRRRRIEENGKFDVSRRDLSRLMHRQRHQCAVCQASLVAASHLDHVIPVSRGGRHSIGNFQYLCPPCNLRKSNMFMSEFKLRIGGD